MKQHYTGVPLPAGIRLQVYPSTDQTSNLQFPHRFPPNRPSYIQHSREQRLFAWVPSSSFTSRSREVRIFVGPDNISVDTRSLPMLFCRHCHMAIWRVRVSVEYMPNALQVGNDGDRCGEFESGKCLSVLTGKYDVDRQWCRRELFKFELSRSF